MSKTNTITVARQLAANIEVVNGGHLDVGKLGSWVRWDGKTSSYFIVTCIPGRPNSTRMFDSRKAQCDYLRDLQ